MKFKLVGVSTKGFKKGDKVFLDPLEPGVVTTKTTSSKLGTIKKVRKDSVTIKVDKDE